ncbi:MAG: cytochrome c3 family protein [Candidatus Krumholzibacteria bacterium]|jgi:DmsE family decaheme c-type cytochrome|nr:cytochrome c3 family protein [Candidatus Krumholzibacteria bacterium]
MRGYLRIVVGSAIILAVQAAGAADHLGHLDVPATATYVGSQDCAMCHEDIVAFYQHSAHSPERGLGVAGSGVYGCEACHGPASGHVEGGGDGWIVTGAMLRGLSGDQRAAMCTQCHVSMDLHYADSPHAGTGISCADCHGDQVHYGSEARPAADFRNRSEFCLQCHSAVVADFRLPFRHRVLEGHLACADCHDHHRGPDPAAWDGVNQTCLGCHPQMAGPFVFEHSAVSGEECLSCHRPHGSHHDKLLNQDGNGLCLQCHFEVTFRAADGWGDWGRFSHEGLLAGEARCYDCHRDVHGSNVSPTFWDR